MHFTVTRFHFAIEEMMTWLNSRDIIFYLRFPREGFSLPRQGKKLNNCRVSTLWQARKRVVSLYSSLRDKNVSSSFEDETTLRCPISCRFFFSFFAFIRLKEKKRFFVVKNENKLWILLRNLMNDHCWCRRCHQMWVPLETKLHVRDVKNLQHFK